MLPDPLEASGRRTAVDYTRRVGCSNELIGRDRIVLNHLGQMQLLGHEWFKEAFSPKRELFPRTRSHL